MIFLAVAKAEGEGGKTSALKVEAEGEAEGLVFYSVGIFRHTLCKFNFRTVTT